MLGVQQQTHSAATHHSTARSSASASVTVTGTLRTPPISKRRQNIVQTPQNSDAVSPTQDNQETHAEAGAASNQPWTELPRDDTVAEGGKNEEDVKAELDNGVQNAPEAQDSSQDIQQRASDETAEQVKREGADDRTGEVDDYTRHPSSPLSELSPAPDDDETLNQDEGAGEGEQGGEANADTTSGLNANNQSSPDGLSDPANSVTLSSDGHATGSVGQSTNHPGHSSNFAQIAAPFGNSPSLIDGLPPSSAPPASTSSRFHPAIATASPEKLFGNAGPSRPSSTSSSKSDRLNKFSVLLELNAELFKVCQAFVAAGCVLHETPEALTFSKKLEGNLTWMSAHVDGVKFVASLPDLDPPLLSPSAAHIAFPDGVFDRINNLYTRLPVVFARDIARRSQAFSSPVSGTPTRNSATPGLLPSSGLGVKRERSDSEGYQRYESPTAPKRRDTGEGKMLAGPSTPAQPGTPASSEMRPPTTPGFSTPSHPQIARPSSTMSGFNQTNTDVQASGSVDGMFSPNSNPILGMGNNMHGLGGMGGLSPDAQARARQTQIRQMQAQAMMQHQQFQQHHAQQQANQNLHRGSPDAGSLPMSSPLRQTQATPSPTHAQQMMQAQAATARQMSPPGAVGGMTGGMGMGVNGMDPNQQGSNMPQSNMGANINGMGTSAGSNMSLNPQMIASLSPAAMAAYQILQNPQHQMTQYLNHQMPGFSQLPMMEQLRRFQIIQHQRQMQQNQRNQQMMANQMMGSQMRPPSTAASGSGPSQTQQIGHSGQMGMAPQLQSSASESAMQLPGTSTSTNMPGRPVTSMGMSQQMGGMSGMQGIPNVANLNPQQRQLYLMQMQMRSSGAGSSSLTNAGMNPAMMNPQLLQERQRLEQQRLMAQRHASPLNPGAGSGQFPPGLRSNPTASIGIARTGRSPSVAGMGDMAGAATPRIGGRMLSGGDDYQRQVLLQQAQRNAQMQHQGFMQGQGQPQGGWSNQQSQQLPLSAGAWPQQNQGFGMGGSPPNTGMQGVDFMSPSRQSSATPAPMAHHSPTAPSTDFDSMMNW